MTRDFGKEIDSLQKELSEIKSLLQAFTQEKKQNEAKKPLKGLQLMKNMHPDKRLSEIMEELSFLTEEKDITGMITYLGVYSSGGRQSNWIRNCINTDDLLKLIEDKTAEKTLACIGNSDRLNILLAILKKPLSVIEIVEECKLNSTGQAYHHMKPLLAANLIVEDIKSNNKGVYIVQPHKVQGIIMLLSGICDMTDETFTKGTRVD